MRLQTNKKPTVQGRKLKVPGLHGHGWASPAPLQQYTVARGPLGTPVSPLRLLSLLSVQPQADRTGPEGDKRGNWKEEAQVSPQAPPDQTGRGMFRY